MSPHQSGSGTGSGGSAKKRAPGSDLSVTLVSEALAGVRLDVVVSGSIGAVESIRFIRSLRRLGAETTPWLTTGGSQFVTPMALGWAAARDCRTGFEAEASHLAENHGCIVAPASASFIAKIANGITDSPAAALVTSYLGQNLPVMILPSMHDSLAHAPQVQTNLANLQAMNPSLTILGSRLEEGKHKVPNPAVLADHCAHVFNAWRLAAKGLKKRILLTLGGTRSWIDDVRYIGNYSTGRLGCLISEELYRHGHAVDVIAGAAEFLPSASSSLTRVKTNDDLETACKDALKTNTDAVVHAAAILDFEVTSKSPGKIPSSSGSQVVSLAPTRKILDSLTQPFTAKVAFKLESGATLDRASAIAQKYLKQHQLTMLVVNNLQNVDANRHSAWIFETGKSGKILDRPEQIEGKEEVARAVARHVSDRITHND